MKNITISAEQFDCLLKGFQVPVNDILKDVGEKYTLTDNNRELTAICIFSYNFHTWKKTIFVIYNNQ